MTCLEKMDEIFSVYSKSAVLSEKNGTLVMKIRHKTLEKELVLRKIPKISPVFTLLRGIRHENIVSIYEVYDLDDGAVILEEYVEGLNVYEISQTGKIKKDGAVEIAKQLCSALHCLHENNIIHRDIKPENVMVSSDCRVKLVDFSAARIMSDSPRDTVIMGTVGYAAPEQLGLSQSEPRTDIYSLGVLLNVMLTGEHPSEKLPDGYLRRVVEKCIAPTLSKRYDSARKLYKALNKA